MSLNGLDEVKVIEAHEAAAAEPGGWFLLKYASRDEVELLGRGSGGVAEVRSSIAQHDDDSPLYGFLRYRRRNVIIKYLPEDCSRIIRARVAVHFNAVCERFSPYDTIFDISTAADLRDTKLSAACSLHAASGSTSSSTSSRRRHLGEIAEEDEEESRASRRQSAADAAGDQRPSTPPDKSLPPDPAALPSDLASSPEPSILSTTTTATSAPPPHLAAPGDAPASPARSLDPDPYNYSPYPTGKPKVKLGPRPSLDATIRPQTAGNFKPVSSIPAGIKLFGKGAKKGKAKDREKSKDKDKEKDKDKRDRDKGGHASSLPQGGSSAPIHPNAVSSTIHSRGESATADRLLLASPIPAPAPGRQTISPEKARLMKAVQLREKKRTIAAALKEQQNAAAATTTTTTTTTLATATATIPSTTPTIAAAAAAAAADPDDHTIRGNTGDTVEDKSGERKGPVGEEQVEQKEDEEEDEDDDDDDEEFMDAVDQTGEHKTKQAAAMSAGTEVGTLDRDPGNADSSVVGGLSPPAHLDESSEITQAESRADSPVIVSSETDHSTLASSLSELTEETVQGKGGHDQARNQTGDERITEKVAPVEGNPTNVEVVEVEALSEPRGSGETRSEETAGQDQSELNQDDTEGLNVPKLMVPKSKFSTQDLFGAARGSSSSPSTVSSPMSEAESKPAELLAKEDEGLVGEQTRAEDDSRKDTGPDDSDRVDNGPSAREALPGSVSAPSSLVPPISSAPSHAPASETSKPVSSNASRGGNLVAPPADPSGQLSRSMSSGAAFLHKVNQQQQQSANAVGVKPIVGSSISQRIKALEMLSASSGDQGRPTSRERPSATFHAVQKREGASVADRAKSLKNAPAPLGNSPDLSRPARKGSPSLADNNNNNNSNTLSRLDSTRSRAESSQTASKPAQSQRAPEPTRDDHGSSTQKHTQATTADEQAAGSEGSSRASGSSDREAKNGKRSSMTKVKEFIKEHRKSTTVSADTQQVPSSAGSPGRPPSSSQQGHGAGSRRSMSGRRSSISRDVSSPTDEDRDDKTMSRAGRFMRRLSGFPSALGKGTASLASSSEEAPMAANPNRRSLTINVGGPSAPAPPPAVAPKPSTSAGPGPSTAAVLDMGDVNVQFPDNLLWKRRNLSLDPQGFLILGASSQNGKVAVGTKRYHMSEFRQPYTPDVEVQELPNSVCLDFSEGGGLQIACEDRLGQINVLGVLRDAHAGHSTFGQ